MKGQGVSPLTFKGEGTWGEGILDILLKTSFYFFQMHSFSGAEKYVNRKPDSDNRIF
jgi:hypothetical protein